MSLLDVALEHAGHGYPVFPLDPRGKQPLGRLVSNGFKDATLDEEIIRRWWTTEPQANIGSPTGVAFDAGDYDDTDAMKRFAALAAEHDLDLKALPRTKTGRGRHILFAPTGLRNRAGVIPGMDWRGSGGYIVMPGSIHPSGAVYEWIKEPNGSGFPTCPEWLLQLLSPPAGPTPASVAVGSVPQAYLEKALAGELDQLRATPEGQRNDALNRAAFALGQMVGAGWLSRNRAETELRDAAFAAGLRDPEVSRTIRSGLESGLLKPRSTPTPLEQRQPYQAAGQDVAEAPVPGRSGPEIYTAEELEDQELPEPRAIVPGVVNVGLNMLAGKGKLGKSWLVLDIALAVARGSFAAGRLPVDQGDVLYLALEDTKKRLQDRIGTLQGNLRFPRRLHISHAWPKLDEGGIGHIEGWLKEHPDASLVIIDVWKRLRHKRQKNAQLYDEDYDHLVPLQAIAQRSGIGVLVVHHTRKAGAEDVFDEISGSGGILAALDACIILHRSRSEADGELWITGRDMEEQHLALKFEGGHWSLIGKAADVTRSKERREVIEAIKAGSAPMTPVEVAEALGKPRGQTKALMYKMLSDGELHRAGNGAYSLRDLPIRRGTESDTAHQISVNAVNGSVDRPLTESGPVNAVNAPEQFSGFQPEIPFLPNSTSLPPLTVDTVSSVDALTAQGAAREGGQRVNAAVRAHTRGGRAEPSGPQTCRKGVSAGGAPSCFTHQRLLDDTGRCPAGEQSTASAQPEDDE